ncbi:hypothetical protein [Bailinhaonella thermotolerans]|uniref:hypothetical protein n=1 Tax=Bailinhaonella thermotolerans TaxID=1070861 RepID=UPI003BEEB47C
MPPLRVPGTIRTGGAPSPGPATRPGTGRGVGVLGNRSRGSARPGTGRGVGVLGKFRGPPSPGETLAAPPRSGNGEPGGPGPLRPEADCPSGVHADTTGSGPEPGASRTKGTSGRPPKDGSQRTALQGTALQGTAFQGTAFQGTAFQGTAFQGTAFQGAALQGAAIQGVALRAGWLSRGRLSRRSFPKGCSPRRRSLRRDHAVLVTRCHQKL